MRNKFLLLTIFSSAFFFLSVYPTNAFVWGAALALAAPLLIFFVKITLFLTIAKVVTGISGLLITWSISAQDFFLKQELVQSTWALLRDFVNIFFILVLLVIAFATIFNKPTGYTAKDLLPKLIIAALLINFSLVIALWVIDITWVPAQVFLNPLSEINAEGKRIPKITEKLAQALNLQAFFDTENISDEEIKEVLNDNRPFVEAAAEAPTFTERSAGTILKGFLIIWEAFVYAWIALLLWARIPMLMGLMIISPIAWLGYTIPHIRKKTWSTWWEKLICWATIPFIVFGLIYFIILFSNQLSLEVKNLSETAQGAFLKSNIPYLGFKTGKFIVWLTTFGLFLGGLTYVKTLSCGLYGWAEAGLKKTWGGIGKGVGFGYQATGAAGAVGRVQKEFKEGRIPIFGARRFGVAQRETKEAKGEDWLRAQAGLGPRFVKQTNLLNQADKETKDLEIRLKASTKAETDRIITDLKKSVAEKSAKGKEIDAETLAAITTLAKRGELEKDLFDNATKQLEKLPLAMTKVFSDWKEGKFGGISHDEFIKTMRDEKKALPLEARRIMYGFLASDDGKKTAEKVNYRDFETGIDVLGRSTKAGRDYTKFWGDFSPVYMAKYRFDNRKDSIKSGYSEKDLEKIKTLQDAIREQMRLTSVKNVADFNFKDWVGDEKITDEIGKEIERQELFEVAFKETIKKKDRKFITELRRRLRREGKDAQFEKLDKITKDLGITIKEEVLIEEEES